MYLSYRPHHRMTSSSSSFLILFPPSFLPFSTLLFRPLHLYVHLSYSPFLYLYPTPHLYICINLITLQYLQFSNSRDVPLVSLRRTTSNTTPGIGGGPRSLLYNSYNKAENNVLITSDAEVIISYYLVFISYYLVFISYYPVFISYYLVLFRYYLAFISYYLVFISYYLVLFLISLHLLTSHFISSHLISYYRCTRSSIYL